MKNTIKKAAGYAKQLENIAIYNKSKRIKRPVKTESLVDKVARKLLEIYYKPRKNFKPSHGKTERGLKQAGLTDEEIQRLK